MKGPEQYFQTCTGTSLGVWILLTRQHMKSDSTAAVWQKWTCVYSDEWQVWKDAKLAKAPQRRPQKLHCTVAIVNPSKLIPQKKTKKGFGILGKCASDGVLHYRPERGFDQPDLIHQEYRHVCMESYSCCRCCQVYIKEKGLVLLLPDYVLTVLPLTAPFSSEDFADITPLGQRWNKQNTSEPVTPAMVWKALRATNARWEACTWCTTVDPLPGDARRPVRGTWMRRQVYNLAVDIWGVSLRNNWRIFTFFFKPWEWERVHAGGSAVSVDTRGVFPQRTPLYPPLLIILQCWSNFQCSPKANNFS